MVHTGGVPVKMTTSHLGPANPHGTFEDNEANCDQARLRHVRNEHVVIKVFPPSVLICLRKAIIPTHAIITRRPIYDTLASWDRAYPLEREIVVGVTREDIIDGKVLASAVSLLRQAHVKLLEIEGDRLIDSPRDVCREIAEFLGRDLDIDAMEKIPDRNLWHSSLSIVP